MFSTISCRRVLIALALAAVLAPMSVTEADARPVRGTTRTSVHSGGSSARNTNVHRNTNVSVNRDIDVDVDDRNDGHWYGGYHPVARTAGALATAAVIGVIVYSLPPSCVTVVRADVTYQQCGSTWYQPQYAGTQVSYVVVNAP